MFCHSDSQKERRLDGEQQARLERLCSLSELPKMT